MGINLIIVESYTKTKTINKYLNDGTNKYIVTFSQGHFCNLPKENLGINITNWTGNYVVTNKKIIDNIRTQVNKSDNIYIASDPDTEGEAIAYHIYNHIKDLIKNKKCYRIKFNEITKKAIKNAIDNPLNIDLNIVNAQETRRFLDRIVGYKLSPILWNKFNDKFLSVGRVQSVALQLCIEKFNNIQNFSSEKYWKLVGKFKQNNIVIDATSDKITDETQLEQILNNLDNINNKFNLKIELSDKIETPKAPYTTTTLQQDAYNLFHYNANKTMEIAQKLYENGYITYMRTDSVNLSNDFKFKLQKYIQDNYGDNYSKIRNFKNKIVNSQEAHEAIRIVNPDIINLILTDELNSYHDKLYNMIWKRTIASQMTNAVYKSIYMNINCINNDKCDKYIFISNKEFLIEKGFLIVYNKELEDYKTYLNSLKQDDNVRIDTISLNCDLSEPASLYSEVTLIKQLEKKGIGRPSTYSGIIDKLLNKKYVIKGKNPSITVTTYDLIKKHKKDIKKKEKTVKTGGNSKDLLVPSQLGIDTVEYLLNIIPFLLNVTFTTEMENALDKIAIGSLLKENVLQEFYEKITPIIDKYGVINNTKKEYNTGIIKTKYGYCYYHKKDNRYLNIEPYLKWKNKSVENLNNNEIEFLSSLPKKIDNNTYLHLGKFGLYLKSGDKNIKLDKKKWDTYINQI